GGGGLQFVQHVVWIPAFNVEYFVGVDGLSILMVLLTALISTIAILASIGIWGGPRKEYAAIKFFLYTLVGSVLILLAIIALYFHAAPTALVDGTPVQ